MSVTMTPERLVKKWRVIVFAVVAALYTLLFLRGCFSGRSCSARALGSWYCPFSPREIWHGAVQGVLLGILFGGSLIAMLWHGERRPVLAQFFLLTTLGFSMINVVLSPLNGGNIIGVVILGLFLLAYPAPRRLFSFARQGTWNLPLLTLSILTALCLTPDVWRNILHATETTNTTLQTNWLVPVVVDLMLVVVGVLSAAKRPGWKVLGIIAGISFLYLGIAALTLPSNVGVLPLFVPVDPLASALGQTLSTLLLLFFPLSMGFAVLRYRLWDIDIVINRTLVYGTLTVSVVGIYTLVVGALGALLQAQGNLVISLLATGLVAVLFQPLRIRLQRAVNHLLYGERDDPYRVISRLGQRLEAVLAPEAVLPTIVETVVQALKLPYAAIALKQVEELVIVASHGTAQGEAIHLSLVSQAEQVGELILAPFVPVGPVSQVNSTS